MPRNSCKLRAAGPQQISRETENFHFKLLKDQMKWERRTAMLAAVAPAASIR